MNRSTHPLRTRLLAVVLALALAAVSAQDQDAYLDRYGLAMGNLERAVEALATDGAQAREELDRAFNALLTLSRDTASGPLASALERVFEHARTAIVNTSQADLAVQAAVLEGGFQRLVYDSSLRAASDGNLELARSRLTRVAVDLGMTEVDRLALADAERSAAALRFDLEAGVADVIARRVAAARELGTGAEAYRALARAYGAFLLVQDSPRAASSLNQAFVEAATALVEERAEDVSAALEVIEADVRTLEEAARERRPAATEATVETAPTEPTELPALTPDPATLEAEAAEIDALEAEALEAEAAEAEALEAEAAEADAAEAEAALVAAIDEGEGGPTAAELLAELGVQDAELLRLHFEEQLRQGRLERLETELGVVGVPVGQRAAQAEALLQAGFERLGMALDAFAADSAAAVAAAHRGDDGALADALGAARASYVAFLSPALRPANITTDLQTLELLQHLEAAAGVRVQDTVVLGGQVEAVRRALQGAAPSAIQDSARETTLLWSGLVRTIVLLVIGVLALIPLILLNLAFGGGNRNWQLIGIALFLLLVPALYEAVVALATVLMPLVGLQLLGSLAAFSVFNSAVAQAAWAAMTLLAVLLASSGLYGICVQFGLVGGRSRAANATRSTRATSPATETIDWDDDI